MIRFRSCFLLLGLIIASIELGLSQTTLSQNSGINASDTYVIMDLGIHSDGSFTAADPAIGSSAATVNLVDPDRAFHMEAGYNANGQMVINLWPTGSNAAGISVIRFVGGQFTAYDQNGVAVNYPAGLPSPQWPQLMRRLRLSSGSSGRLAVSNMQALAQGTSSTLTTGQSVSTLSRPFKGGATGTVTSTFQSSGGVWVPSQVAVSLQEANGSGNFVTNLTNVVTNDNSTNDAARAGQTSTSASIPAQVTTAPSGVSQPSSSSSCPGQSGAGQNIVFQHGIASSCSTWPRMVNWLNQDFFFGTEVAPSLSSLDALSNQSAALVQQIQSAGGSNYILLGHSQGGLVSRSAAQYFQANSPSTIQGVITLDSPNTGALIAQHGYQYLFQGVQSLSQKLWDDTGCLSASDNFGCFLAALVFDLAPDLAVFGVATAAPATFDNVPGSPFLVNLNSQTENFVRVGVIGNSQQRWLIARLLADALNGQPDGTFGGRAVVVYIEIFYDLVLFDQIIALDNSFYDCGPYGNPDDCAFDLAEIDFDTAILRDMNRVNSFWNNLVANPGDGSDGFVQSSSQNYSGAVNYPIANADSHVGATKSDKVRVVLDQTLNREFFVPKRACSYTLSISSLSVSFSGTSGTFTVQTADGCSWSITSSVPWMTITSGASGTGPGTVTFTIAPNESIGRTVTLTVANQTLTIVQAPGPGVWWPAIQQILD